MKDSATAFRCFLFIVFVLFLQNNVWAATVSPTSITIGVGASANISVTNISGTVTARSSNISVATVTYASGRATVRGVKAGSATITIRDRRASRTVSVKVTAPALSVTPLTVPSLSINSTTTLTVTNASGTVNVNSSDNSVLAIVSYASGIATIRGLKAGSAIITVSDNVSSKTVKVTVVNNTPPPPPAAGNYTLLAWNDLGMHCMDGVDFSVFTILPPYNTLHAQLKDKAGKLITSGVKLTYQAVEDSTKSINTESATKTNFWQWSSALFGLSPAENVGLNLDGLATAPPLPTGNKAPSLTPAPMSYNTKFKWFEAEGIPVTPIDDSGKKNFYPTVKVVAKDSSDNVLAQTTTVLPVSDEMTCKGCHASNSPSNDARPVAGWVNNPNLEKDWKLNILRLHDEKVSTDLDLNVRNLYAKALSTVGYSPGLLASANSGKPVLCVSCHASNAYYDKENEKTVMGGLTIPGFVDAAGKQLIPPFTQVLHELHADVKDPTSVPAYSATLNDSKNRNACYNCHPGSKTQCLRGAMGKATTANGESLMSCQSCHGDMEKVASPARKGWFNEPTCESCHNNDNPSVRRAVSAFKVKNGPEYVPADHTFATNANTPAQGLNLYRFSTGHGGLQCEACHGSTHAEYPSLHADDNTQSIAVQGHAGTVAECTACHKTVPTTVNGGPHGMHTTGNRVGKITPRCG